MRPAAWAAFHQSATQPRAAFAGLAALAFARALVVAGRHANPGWIYGGRCAWTEDPAVVVATTIQRHQPFYGRSQGPEQTLLA